MYNRCMDRKSKILLYTFFFLFVTTVMFSYTRYMVFRDFEVVASEVEEDSLDVELEISSEEAAETDSEEISQ